MKCIKNVFKLFLQVFFAYIFLVSESWSSPPCSREGSRLVRKVLEKNFYPLFEAHGVNISEECPLKRSRDLYLIQEQNKLFEHHARWSCEVCGKAFYKQEFLDIHMGNKHKDLLLKEEFSPVCLADYCQLFRCEALKREKRSAHFWSKTLCNGDNMAKLKTKCLKLVKSCIPFKKASRSYEQLYYDIIEETCSLLNCKDYWRPLEFELSPYQVLYYLTFTPLFIFALVIYYYNIWEYFFGEESEKTRKNESQRRESSDNDLPGLRKRFANSRFEY